MLPGTPKLRDRFPWNFPKMISNMSSCVRLSFGSRLYVGIAYLSLDPLPFVFTALSRPSSVLAWPKLLLYCITEIRLRYQSILFVLRGGPTAKVVEVKCISSWCRCWRRTRCRGCACSSRSRRAAPTSTTSPSAHFLPALTQRPASPSSTSPPVCLVSRLIFLLKW